MSTMSAARNKTAVVNESIRITPESGFNFYVVDHPSGMVMQGLRKIVSTL